MTSHAAVVARGLGKPCVVGAGDAGGSTRRGEVRVAGQTFREGDELSIDGTTGEVLAGGLATRPSPVLRHLLEGDRERRRRARRGEGLRPDRSTGPTRSRRLRVRANADTPADARAARAFGAQGIGLCRTEHMFFDEGRISWVRRMILAADDESAQRGARRPAARTSRRTSRGSSGRWPACRSPSACSIRRSTSSCPEDAGAGAARRGHGDRAGRAGRARSPRSPRSTRCSATAAAASASPRRRSTACRPRRSCAPPAPARRRATRSGPEIMVPLVGTEEELARLRERDLGGRPAGPAGGGRQA